VDEANKREKQRIELLGTLEGEVMVFQPTTVRQISRGGMQVETGFPLHLDSLHDFRLTLGGRSIVIKGRIAHCRISDVDQDIVVYRSGIEFIDPPERVTVVIDEFVTALSKDQSNVGG
jgi:PilZ domain